MKSLTLFTTFCAMQLTTVLVNGEAINRRHLGKRAVPLSATGAASTSSGSLPTPTAIVATGSAAALSSTGAPGTVAGTGTTPTPVVAGTPPAATGTDIPALSLISSGMPTRTARAAATTYAPGAQPPISGAPKLPTLVTAVSLPTASYPAENVVPDTNSPQVQQWMKELDGFNIPDLQPTVDGSCASDPQFAADSANRGWWTCGGVTRDTDIVACPDKFTWGVSFDDGPSPYTPYVLDFLQQKNLSATFFVVGSRILERPQILVQEYMAGHEISVHTWSHSKPLTSLTNAELVAELGWTRQIIKDVIGVTPTTMRPPWGDIDDRVRAVSMAMGMIPVIWTRSPSGSTFDTNDWKVAGGQGTAADSFNTFQTILSQASQMETGFVVLEHDLFEVTVDIAIGYTLNAALNNNPKFNLEAIGQCQKFPAANMYLETNTNKTFPFPKNNATGANGSGTAAGSNSGGNNGKSGALRTLGLEQTKVVGVAVLVLTLALSTFA